jgi:hypothetical protein
MEMRTEIACLFTLSIVMLATSAAAQDPVPDLQDLIGASGTVVDGLDARGYTYHRADKSADSSLTYWLENSTGRCVAARVTDGNVVSIAYSDGDCVESADVPPAAGFSQTVCGVIRDGETYRYRCEVMDDVDNDNRTTTLRLPDNEMKFVWLDDSRVSVEMAGLVPIDATYSTSEGETDIFTPEMTYFYISDPGMAAIEVRNFSD